MANGFTFNGIHSSTMGILGVRAPRNIFQGRKTELVTIPYRTMPYVIVDDSRTPETITVECFLNTTSTNPYDLGSSWSTWLVTNTFVELVFDESPNLTYMAIMTSPITLSDFRNPIVSIEFTATVEGQ